MVNHNLKDFLSEKARQTNQLERRRRREEWVAAVHRLMGRLQDWLRQADPDHVLDVGVIPIEKRELGIGTYQVPSLDIRYDETVIRVLPVGRNVLHGRSQNGNETAKAQGRVDITDGANKYYLYRFIENQSEQWEIQGEEGKTTLLDQAQFERIIEELLS
jgi:hypothetical protein